MMTASAGPPLMPKIRKPNQSTSQSINQSNDENAPLLSQSNQHISTSRSQSTNQSVSQPVHQSDHRPTNQPINQALNQSVNPPNRQPINHSTNQSNRQPVNQSINQLQVTDVLSDAWKSLVDSDLVQDLDSAAKIVNSLIEKSDSPDQSTNQSTNQSYATQPSICAAVVILWICLFLLFHTSTPLVLTFTIGSLLAYSLEIADLSEMSSIICLLSSVTLSLLIMFFHDVPSSVSFILKTCIICTYLLSIIVLMIWFALRSPLLSDKSFVKQRLLGDLLLMAMLPVVLTMVIVMSIASISSMDYSNLSFIAVVVYLLWIEICCIRPTLKSPEIVYWHAVFVFLWPWITHTWMHPRAAFVQYFFSECLLLLSIGLIGLARLSYLHNRFDTHPLGLIGGIEKSTFELKLAVLGFYGLTTGVTLRLIIPLMSTISWRFNQSVQFSSIILVAASWFACTSLLVALATPFMSGSKKVFCVIGHIACLTVSVVMVMCLLTGDPFMAMLFVIFVPQLEVALLQIVGSGSPYAFCFWAVEYCFLLLAVTDTFFGFLDMSLSGAISLSSLLTLIVMTAWIGAFAPALPRIALPIYSDIRRFAIVFYFSLLTMCEMLLYQQNELFDTAIWPWECVIFTSVVGIFLSRFLFTRKRIEAPVYAMMVCLCVSKLGLLLVDTTLDFLQCVAIVVSVVLPALWPPQGKPRLITHGALIVLAFWWGKNSVLAHLMSLMGFASANEATYLSAFLVAISVCLAPLTFLRASSPSVRRGHLYLVIITLCFALTQPRMPGLLDSQSDILTENIQSISMKDWYLFLALSLTSLNVVSLVPLPSLTLAIVSGALFGLYVAASLPFHFTLYIFFVPICTVASMFAERIATCRAIPPRAAASRALPYLINGSLVLTYFALSTVNIVLLEHSEWSALFLAPILIFTQPPSSRAFTIRFDRSMGLLLALYLGALPVTLLASFVLFSDEVMHGVHVLLLTIYASSALVFAVIGSIKQGTFLASSATTLVKGKTIAITTSDEGRYFVAATVLSVNLCLVGLYTLFSTSSLNSFGWLLAQSATLIMTLPGAVAMIMSLNVSTSNVSPVLGVLALVCSLIAAALTYLGSVRALAIMSAVVLFRQVVDKI